LSSRRNEESRSKDVIRREIADRKRVSIEREKSVCAEG